MDDRGLQPSLSCGDISAAAIDHPCGLFAKRTVHAFIERTGPVRSVVLVHPFVEIATDDKLPLLLSLKALAGIDCRKQRERSSTVDKRRNDDANHDSKRPPICGVPPTAMVEKFALTAPSPMRASLRGSQ